MLFSYLKFLHILSMFGAVSLFLGGEAILGATTRSMDVRAIRRVARTTKITDNIGIVLFLVGVGFGVGTAWVGDFDFFQPWLIIAYALAGLVVVEGFVYFEPHGARLRAAADQSPDEAPSEELARLINPRRETIIMVQDTLLWASIIFVMVVKPFS